MYSSSTFTSICLLLSLLLTLLLLFCSCFSVAITVLSGDLNIGYQWLGSYLYWTMDAPTASNTYFAVGVDEFGTGGMSSKAVVCKRPIQSETTAECQAITTASYSFSARIDASMQVVSASAVASRSYVTVRMDAALMGVTAPGSKRIIFAIGNWDATNSVPKRHASRDSTTITFVNSSTSSSTASGGSPSSLSSTSTTNTLTTMITTTATATMELSTANTSSNTTSTTTASTSSATTTNGAADSTSSSSSSSSSSSTSATMATTTSSPSSSFAQQPSSAATSTSTAIQQQSPSTSTTTTTVTMPTTTNSPATSSGFVELNDRIRLAFNWTADGYLDATLSSPIAAGTYFAFAFAPQASQGMADGIGAACRQPTSSSSSPPVCTPIRTLAAFDISARTDVAFTVTSYWLDSNRAYVSLRMSASLVLEPALAAGTSWATASSVTAKCLFAIGSWDSASSLPAMHSSSNRGGTPVTLVKEEGTASSAPPATTGASATATTTISRATMTTTTTTTTVAPQQQREKSYTGLGGTVAIEWDLGTSSSSSSVPGSSNNKNMTIDISSTESNRYKAIAWATTPGGMGPGTGFACIVLTTPTVTAKCRDISTASDYRVSLRQTQVTRIVSFQSFAAGGWAIKVTTPTTALNASHKNAAGFARVLLSSGAWDAANDLPGPHANTASSRASPYINFATGGAADSPENTFWRFKATMGVCFCLFIFLGIAGAMLRSKHESAGPTTALVLKGVGLICVCGSFVACLIAAYWDFVEFNATEPLFRAFGAACSYFFCILLFPTTKLPTIFNIGHFAGSSYERFINLHIITGLMLFVFVLTHFGMMVATMTKTLPFADAILVTTGKAPLYAFVGLICFSCMVVTALLRRRFYSLFRYTHLLFPVVLTMFCLHFPLLAIAIVPGALAYVTDFCWRILTQCWANSQLVSVVHNSDCGVTQLRVRVTDDDYDVEAGQFALVTCYAVSPIAHPFTIANYVISSGELTFYIKNLGGPWTKKFSELAAAERITSVSVSRPIGQLGISLAASPVVFLCCGGIGITPILSIATHIGHEISEGNITGLHTVHIIWSVREDSLVELLLPELLRVIAAIELRGVADQGRDAEDALANMLSDVSVLRGNQTAVNCTVYKTNGKSGRKGCEAMRPPQQQQAPAPSSAGTLATASARRSAAAAVAVASDDDSYLEELLTGRGVDHDDGLGILNGTTSSREMIARGRSSAAASPASKQLVPRSRVSRITGRPKFAQLFGIARGEGLAVSVFSCGPAPFMDEVRKQASDYDCLLHEESFEL